jgi:putrescine aminotransferase
MRATIRLADDSSLLDFETGGFGHGARQVESAVVAQMSVNPLATRHFLSLPLANFASHLADACPGDLEVSYFCNSGAEAVEGALKLARGFHGDRRRFVALEGAYHGSTLGALSVCGVEEMRTVFTRLPLDAAFASDANRVEDLVNGETAAVIVEPWPGNARFPGFSEGWLRELSRRCAATGALLIADETRSGIGRTGVMFAIEHEEVVPDILVFGGALGGGVLPVAGYVAGHRVNDRVYGRRDPTLHASATGGNPAACAAGVATLRMIEEEGLLNQTITKGDLLLTGLRTIANRHPETIAGAHGVGLFARVDFHREGAAAVVVETAFERGLAIRCASAGARSVGIELSPPMLASEAEIQRGLRIFGDAVAEASSREAPG